MQAIMETLFDAAYLVTVVTLGCIMVKSAQDRETKLFGWMAVILGCGDAFHLVPRAWALCTDGLAAHAAALGAGKFITSITMTIFYVILYHIGKRRYGLHIRALTGAVYALAAARIGLCLFPQNAWLSANPPLSWGIWRNVPFALLGALVMAVVSVPYNYFIVYPAYVVMYHLPLDAIIGMYQAINPNVNGLLNCLLVFNLPFTFFKGMLDAVICFAIYKPLSPILHGRNSGGKSVTA